jgi:hypothetical protein
MEGRQIATRGRDKTKIIGKGMPIRIYKKKRLETYRMELKWSKFHLVGYGRVIISCYLIFVAPRTAIMAPSANITDCGKESFKIPNSAP